jgi:hypothetical protein
LATALQFLKTSQPYTLAGFEPGNFRSGDGHDDHYAVPPGHFFEKLPFWGRCYDFLNIFAEKFGEKIGVFDSKQS